MACNAKAHYLLCSEGRSKLDASRGLLQAWPDACGGGAVAVRAVLVYSATLLNAPYIQTAPALQATQSALAADLLQCNTVGAFTAGACVPVQ